MPEIIPGRGKAIETRLCPAGGRTAHPHVFPKLQRQRICKLSMNTGAGPQGDEPFDG